MYKYSKLIIILGVLIAVAFISRRGQVTLWASALAYRSPLAQAWPTAGESVPSQSEKVVVVVVSGLGNHVSSAYNIPALRKLQESGASAEMTGVAPSYKYATRTTLVSGALPTINDSQLLDFSQAAIHRTTVDTIFHRAHHQPLNTVLAGEDSWQQIVSPTQLTQTFFPAAQGQQTDQWLIDKLASVIDDDSTRLIVLQLNQVEQLFTRDTDLTEEEIQRELDVFNDSLEHLVSMIDLNRTTLLVTADYGLLDNGAHGGADSAVLQLPFIMAGKNVIPGTYNTIQQIDLAPTIAVLLGTAFPAANQGRPLLEMLKIEDRQKAQIWVTLAQQQFSLAKAWQHQLTETPLPEPAETDISKAQDFLNNNNYAGTARLTYLLVEQSQTSMNNATLEKLNAEKNIRLLLVAVFLTAIGVLLFRNRSDLWAEALFSALTIPAIYHLIYRLQGEPYSLSAVADINRMGVEIMSRMALSVFAGGLIFLILLVLQQYTNGIIILQSSYELIFIAVLGFFIPVLYGFWQIGPSVTWIFPDVTEFFYYLTGLYQTFWMILLGFFLPIFVIALNALLQKTINFYHARTAN